MDYDYMRELMLVACNLDISELLDLLWTKMSTMAQQKKNISISDIFKLIRPMTLEEETDFLWQSQCSFE